jgi:RNA polymerase sigma-70 factor (ECF subfamily)
VASDDRPVQGDRERFESLYRAHYGAIMRYAARRTDEQTARDVTAETFLVAWRRLGSVPEPDALRWLYATARNVLRHERRCGSRHARLGERLSAQPVDVAADVADSVVDRLHYRQLLAALPGKEREAIELVQWEHLDIATAACVVGCSTATFRVRLHRARRRLSAAVTSVDLITEEVPS